MILEMPLLKYLFKKSPHLIFNLPLIRINSTLKTYLEPVYFFPTSLFPYWTKPPLLGLLQGLCNLCPLVSFILFCPRPSLTAPQAEGTQHGSHMPALSTLRLCWLPRPSSPSLLRSCLQLDKLSSDSGLSPVLFTLLKCFRSFSIRLIPHPSGLSPGSSRLDEVLSIDSVPELYM